MKHRKSAPTAAQVRRANRGNVPGFLGMAEMAMLTKVPCRPCNGSGRVPSGKLCPLCSARGRLL